MYDPSNNFYGWAVAMKRGPSIVHDWCAFFNGFGGKTFVDAPSNYASGFNSEIGVKTTQMFKDMLQYLPEGVLQYENADRWNAFMHGQAGMVAVFNANSPLFDSAEDTQVAGKVGYFGMPKLDESAAGSLPLDNLASPIISYVAFNLPFVILMLQGFFRNVPNELYEAAKLDGCGHSGRLYGWYCRFRCRAYSPR